MEAFLHWSQAFADVATCLALVGVAVAYLQLRAGALAEKRTAAITAWTEYLKLALTHPDLALPDLVHSPSWLASADRSNHEVRQYRWFVATMLFACEQVLDAHPEDKAWAGIVAAQLRNHHAFLSTRYFNAAVYSQALATLAKQVKREAPQVLSGEES